MPETAAVREALRRSVKDLEDLRYALDQSAIVASTDVQGDITYVNDKFCDIAQYSREELLGKNHRLINSGLHPIDFFREMYRVIARGDVWRGEIRNRAKDGSHYWVDTTIVPLMGDDGKPQQYVSIRYEITERKQTEARLREQAALARVGKMAAVVAHEVRNPLAGIRGALQVIGSRLPADSSERAVASEIIARLDALNAFVSDLLDFARPREPVLAPVPIAAVALETASLMRQDPAFSQIDVQVNCAGITIDVDRELLKMVLLNLLMNGAQAMNASGVLTITAQPAGDRLEVQVSDQGPGIPVDVLEHVFEPFFTTKHRGTGLGLATARRIVEMHRGTLDLVCPAAGGTVAVITLPLETVRPLRRVERGGNHDPHHTHSRTD